MNIHADTDIFVKMSHLVSLVAWLHWLSIGLLLTHSAGQWPEIQLPSGQSEGNIPWCIYAYVYFPANVWAGVRLCIWGLGACAGVG